MRISRTVKLPWWQVFIGLLLGWIGLAGFADNLVVWKEWFDVGIMAHWRALKYLIIDELLFWLPFRVPDWFFDYIVIGLIFGRSYFLFSKGFIDDNQEKVDRFFSIAAVNTKDSILSELRSIISNNRNNELHRAYVLKESSSSIFKKSGVIIRKSILNLSAETREALMAGSEIEWPPIQKELNILKREMDLMVEISAHNIVSRSEEDEKFKFFFRTSRDRFGISICFVLLWPVSIILFIAMKIFNTAVDKDKLQYFNGKLIGYDDGHGFQGYSRSYKLFIQSSVALGDLVSEVMVIFLITTITFIPVLFVVSNVLYQFFPPTNGS